MALRIGAAADHVSDMTRFPAQLRANLQAIVPCTDFPVKFDANLISWENGSFSDYAKRKILVPTVQQFTIGRRKF
jgi:hypothetical protein